MPPCSVNQTCESVEVAVPTASLLAGVQVGMAPGAPGAFCALLVAGDTAANRAKPRSKGFMEAKEVTFQLVDRDKKGEAEKQVRLLRLLKLEGDAQTELKLAKRKWNC